MVVHFIVQIIVTEPHDTTEKGWELLILSQFCTDVKKGCCLPLHLLKIIIGFKLFERFAKACNDFSMAINLKKTVVMSLGTSIPPRILISGSPLNVVDKFSYLGSVVNSSNNLDDEIN